MNDAFEDGLIEAIPPLRAMARSYVRDASSADDLVQTTLLRALNARHQFTPGTNLRAWLFTIMRNAFINERRRQREVSMKEDFDIADMLPQQARQMDRLQVLQVQKALEKIRPEQREALMLVFVAGFGLAEAAEVCGCAVGTIKSRISRGRDALMVELGETERAGLTWLAAA